MSSPRKRRNLDDCGASTPTKMKKNIKEEKADSPLKFKFEQVDWAEVSMNCSDASVNIEIKNEVIIEGTVEETGPAARTRSRKNKTPKRNADGGKAKFERVLDLSSALSAVRSERVQKLEGEKRRNERGESAQQRSAERPNRRNERKRQRSGSSMSVATEDGGTPRSGRSNRKNPRVGNSQDKLSLSSPRTPQSVGRRLTLDETMSPKPKEDYLEPKLGWCKDESTLKRRTKEVEKAKEKDVYKRYIDEVPLMARERNSHPKTPNKYLNYSRRNWDTQVKNWKRALYNWAGEDCPSSVDTSRASSVCGQNDDPHTIDLNEDMLDAKKLNTLSTVLEHPDAVASMFGHFDMNTRQGTLMGAEESTLKANENLIPNAPTDFSQFIK